MEELEEVLRSLKTNKARDPEGISRTIFKNNVICTNWKESLLILFNKLKSAGKNTTIYEEGYSDNYSQKGGKKCC